MGAVWRGSSAGMCESLAARISAFTSPTVCVDTVPPVPRSRVWVLVDDGVAGAGEGGRFPGNPSRCCVELVQEDGRACLARRRAAAGGHENSVTARTRALAEFTGFGFTDGHDFLRMAAPLSLGVLS